MQVECGFEYDTQHITHQDPILGLEKYPDSDPIMSNGVLRENDSYTGFEFDRYTTNFSPIVLLGICQTTHQGLTFKILKDTDPCKDQDQ